MAAVSKENFLFTIARYAPFIGPFACCFHKQYYDYFKVSRVYQELKNLDLQTERPLRGASQALIDAERLDYQQKCSVITWDFNRFSRLENENDICTKTTAYIRSGRISTVLTVALLVSLAVGGLFTSPLAYVAYGGLIVGYTMFGGVLWGLAPLCLPHPKAGEFEALSAQIKARLGGAQA